MNTKGGVRSKLSFAVQGLQASETLTGYGLQLGGVMGALSDTVWASLNYMNTLYNPIGFADIDSRFLTSDHAYSEASESARNFYNQIGRSGSMLWEDARAVIPQYEETYEEFRSGEIEYEYDIFGDDRSSPEQKAFRVLIQWPQVQNFARWLSDDDLIRLIAANRMATSILFGHREKIDERRIDIIPMLPFPTAKPVDPVSRQALKDSGIDLANARPALKTASEYPTIGHAIDSAISGQETFEAELRYRANQNPNVWSAVYQMWHEAGWEVLERVAGISEDRDLEYPSYILSTAKLAETNLALEPPYTDDDLRLWWLGAQREADVSGRDYPNRQDWINSALKNGLRARDKQ